MAKWLGILFVFALGCSLAVAVGFPWKQAFLLAILAAYVERGLYMAATNPRHNFEPYYVRVIPTWDQILTGYAVEKSDEDWQKFTDWCGGKALPRDWFFRAA